MKSTPRISETEWEIMRVIWQRHPVNAAEVIERLAREDSSWHPKTVRTLLSRLVKKRALDYESEGRAYVYQPRVSETQCIAAASESFLERVFGGSLQPMLAHFVETKKLSNREIEELKRLLEGKENQA